MHADDRLTDSKPKVTVSSLWHHATPKATLKPHVLGRQKCKVQVNIKSKMRPPHPLGKIAYPIIIFKGNLEGIFWSQSKFLGKLEPQKTKKTFGSFSLGCNSHHQDYHMFSRAFFWTFGRGTTQVIIISAKKFAGIRRRWWRWQHHQFVWSEAPWTRHQMRYGTLLFWIFKRFRWDRWPLKPMKIARQKFLFCSAATVLPCQSVPVTIVVKACTMWRCVGFWTFVDFKWQAPLNFITFLQLKPAAGKSFSSGISAGSMACTFLLLLAGLAFPWLLFCLLISRTTTTTTRNKQSLRPRPFSLFLPYSTNKDCSPLCCSAPPPWNNQSATPFLCFFLFLQTKTVAPSVVLTPPLQQPFYKQRLWPLVLFWPPPFNNTSTKTTHKMMLNREPLTRWCWIDDHSQDDVE